MSGTARGRIGEGQLARLGVLDAAAVERAGDIVGRVEADGIETIRLVFPDQHGILRGKTIVAGALIPAFASGIGVPSTLLLKDTSHRTVFDIWEGGGGPMPPGAGDLILVPDASAFHRLPWAPHSALILCDPVFRSGAPARIAPRHVLAGAVARLAEAGFAAIMGLEVEFQVFARLDAALEHGEATMPGTPIRTRNLTQGHQYLTETRYGEAEELLDALRRAAEQMGLAPRSVEIEMGPSQFEFTFDAADPMTQADRMVLFRTLVKEICHRRGLHASFMAKPALPNAAANGWHIHQSLSRLADGAPVFMPQADGVPTPEASAWIAGLLDHAAAACLLTTPTVTGYKRYAPFQLAPNRVLWGTDNRGAMIRALLFAGDPSSRIENRAPDSSANPYFALTAQILCGLDGMRRGASAPPASETPYAGAPRLPASLIDAIAAFEASPLFAEMPGADFVRYLAHLKRAEWERHAMAVSDWEQAEYFNLF